MTVNILALVVATIVGFLAGRIWYMPPFFGKIWGKLKNMTKKDMDEGKKHMRKKSIVGVLLHLIKILGLMYMFQLLEISHLNTMLLATILIRLGFIFTTNIGEVLWNKQVKRWLGFINAGGILLMLLVSVVVYTLF